MISVLLDHIWQSTAFVLIVAAIQTVFRSNAARHRYWLWFAASIKFLVPFSLLMAVGAHMIAPAAPPPPPAASIRMIQEAAVPFAGAEPLAAAPAPAVSWLLLLGAVWALGCGAVLAAWARRWRQIDRAVRASRRLDIEAPLPVIASPHRIEPGLVGIWRPVLLLPEGINAKLSKAQMRTVIAHELSHQRRGDNLTAALHMLVEALFWFHPLVWWLGRRLADERERACDEAVLEAGGDPKAYAEGILKVCRHYVQSPLACAAGISGADLRDRIERIIIADVGARLTLAKKLTLSLLAAAAVVAPVWLGWVSSPLAASSLESVARAGRDFAQLLADQQRPRQPVPYRAEGFDRFVGYYQLGPQLVLTVARYGDRFTAQLTGRDPVELYPESPTKFFAKTRAQQVSFITDHDGPATGLVLHEYGYEQHATRIAGGMGSRAEAAIAARIERNAPSPGTETSLRRYIASLQGGQPNYDEMSPVWAARVKALSPQMQAKVRKWGALRRIEFRGVNSSGHDIYDAVFENAKVEWVIAPLSADSKIQGRWYTELPHAGEG